MLSGGYGGQPTNLLHYSYGWHPALGWLVKTLFLHWPHLNWYTIFLLTAQLISFSAILYVSISWYKKIIAYLFFGLLFLFVECWALLSLNYTFTAWVMALSACLLLLHGIRISKWSDLVVAFILLVLAGMLRLQVAFVVILLMLPAFFMYARKSFRIWTALLISALIVISSLSIQQSSYYRRHISNWGQQETVRQSLFYRYNRPFDHRKDWHLIFKDSMEAIYYYNHFYFDSTIFSSKRIIEINKAMTRSRDFTEKEDWQVFKWLFAGLKIYILLFGLLIFIGWREELFSNVPIGCLLPFAMVLSVYVFLELFLKVTPGIHMGLQSLLFIYIALALKQVEATTVSKHWFIYLFILMALSGWQLKRLYERNHENILQNNRFSCVARELNEHPEKLFIATDDKLPLGFFYCWSSPGHYPLSNLVYKDRILTNTYQEALKGMKIKDPFAQISNSDSIRVIGGEEANLVKYYKAKYNLHLVFVPAKEKYNCMQVFKGMVVP
jgi:hypothetical protein